VSLRHYQKLNLSAAYEPYLLRWEINTQKNLGNNIAKLLVNIGVSITAVSWHTITYLHYTVIIRGIIIESGG
jgi:hypothetical protein